MFCRKWIKQYVLLFLAMVLVCIALLYVAGLVPQEQVAANIQRSSEQFEDEGEYPYVFDSWSEVYRLDAFSESLILNHSFYMDTRESPIEIIDNPCYRDGWHPVTSLIALGNDPTIEPTSGRSHYWLGFRAIVRPLLGLIPYQNIRGVLSGAFFTLFIMAVMMLQKKADTLSAICLMLTIISMNPVVVSTSLQFSCCFLIAFVGIIAVGLIYRSQRTLLGVFLLLGQLTMYFDFYTSPLITWGLPFIALISILRRQERLLFTKSLKLMGITLLMWAVGYAGMTVMKMLLTTAFTAVNGFEAVLSRLLQYTGVDSFAEAQATYTAWGALYNCLKNVFTVPNLFALVFAVLALAIYLLVQKRRGGICVAASGVWNYVLVGALPVLWLMVASQASGRHAYFQYRTLAVMVYAAFCLAAQLFEPKKKSE